MFQHLGLILFLDFICSFSGGLVFFSYGWLHLDNEILVEMFDVKGVRNT